MDLDNHVLSLETRNRLETFPDGILVHQNNKIIYFNFTLLKLLGYSKNEEVVGLSPLSIVHPDQREASAKRAEKLKVHDGVFYAPRVNTVLLKKCGGEVDVEADAFNITLDGQPAMLGLVRDVSQRKEERRLLEETRAFLVSSQKTGGIGSWAYDLEGKAKLRWTEETYYLLGVDKTKTDLTIEDFLKLVHPEDQGWVREAVESVGRSNPRLEIIYRVVWPNGTLHWIKAKGEVVSNGKNEPLRVIGVVQDITEQKTAEDMLRASETRFKAVYEGTPDSLLIIDNLGRILYANQAATELFKESHEDLRGKPLADFYDSSFDLAGARKIIWETGIFKGEMRLRTADQEVRNTELEVKGQILPGQTLVVIKDVTEKKRIEQQVALTDKLATVGTLAAGVAHEINNPLGFIMGTLELLKEMMDKMVPVPEKDGPKVEVGQAFHDEAHRYLSQTIDGTERIRDIVRGLKSFSRSTGDEMTQVNVNNLLDAAISMTLHEIKYKARLERELAQDLPLLVVNITRLQQVFVNILINAAQALPTGNVEGNRVVVRTLRDGEKVKVLISDSGKGIPPEILPRIFDPFFTTKPVGVGTGLGLSISRDIIRGYGGDIEVESRLGEGTTFTVSIPIATDRKVTEKSGTSDTKPIAGLRVLLVDDEPDNVALFSRMLRRNDVFVIGTSSATEALEILDRGLSKVDVIVSDLNMPDMNGIDFYKTLEKRNPDLVQRVVFVTGGIFSGEMAEFLDRIPNPKIEKPFGVAQLLQAIYHVAAKED